MGGNTEPRVLVPEEEVEEEGDTKQDTREKDSCEQRITSHPFTLKVLRQKIQ